MSEKQEDQYWARISRRFAQNRFGVWSIRIAIVLGMIAVLADFIANEIPLYCKLDGKHHFPVFREYLVDAGLAGRAGAFKTQDWKNYKYEKVVRAPIPYSSTSVDLYNSFVSPFGEQAVKSSRFRHFMGTDRLGRDLAAGLVSGTRTAFFVGIVSMAIALLIGVFFGGIAGYFGDHNLKISRGRMIFNVIGIPLAFFWAFIARSYTVMESSEGWPVLTGILLFFIFVTGFNLLVKFLKRFSFFAKKITIPVDLIVMRMIEVINSVPMFLLLLALIAIIEKQSIYKITLIIGLFGWRGIARFVRAELMRIRTLSYVEAARAMGFSDWRIMIKHALPNALSPVLVAVSFGIAGAVLAEASLSFLGIGIPSEQVTWGSMLQSARLHIPAWWLAVFPGLAIFITITIFNLIGEGLTDALDARAGNNQEKG